jgi:hypothetical protein
MSAQARITLDEEFIERLADALAPKVAELLPGTSAPCGDPWMDAREAAAYLGFKDVDPLHKLTAARTVPFSQKTRGGKLWFRRSDLDAWRGSQRTGTRP